MAIELFGADDGVHGRELWLTDGTKAGTVLVKDIFPGAGGSGVTNLTRVGAKVFFTATDQASIDIWASDGTSAGTYKVTSGLASPGNLAAYGAKLYFTVSGGTPGLYSTDGTAGGATLVTSASSTFATPTVVNGLIYFAGTAQGSGASNLEPWVSDGTAAGTHLLQDINANGSSLSATSNSFTAAGGLTYFTATDPTHGSELWASDGTSAGTHLVSDIVPGANGSTPTTLVAAGNRLVFLANGGYLYGTDGTAAGTVALTSANTATSPFALNGQTVTFFGSDSAHSFGLYRTDGTAAGTSFVAAVSNGGFAAVLLNGVEYVYGSDGVHTGLFRSDGTAAGTSFVAATGSFANAAVVGNKIFFQGSDTAHGAEAWVSDGTAAGTGRLADINPGSYASSPTAFAAAGVAAVFVASNASSGAELYASNGTAAGTSRIDAFTPAVDHSTSFAEYRGVAVGANTFFIANTPEKYFPYNFFPNFNLCKTDGTTAGTQLIQQLSPYRTHSTGHPDPSVGSLISLNGLAIAQVSYDSNYVNSAYTHLSASNGTTDGTTELAVTNSTSPLYKLNDGVAFFTGYVLNGYSSAGTQLYRTDGTTSGTFVIANVSSTTLTPFAFGGLEYFSGTDSTHGSGLYRSDGSVAGTTFVASFAASGFLGTVGSSAYLFGSDATHGSGLSRLDNGSTAVTFVTSLSYAVNPTIAGSHIYFVGNDSTHGSELWVTDGTAAGTHITSDIYPGQAGSGPYAITAAGDRAVFDAYTGSANYVYGTDGNTVTTLTASGAALGFAALNATTATFLNTTSPVGPALYRSDGTAGGTSIVTAFTPYADASTVAGSTSTYAGFVVNGVEYLFGSDGVHGIGLYRTDGTAAGTSFVAATGSFANPFSSNGYIYFQGSDAANGTELWVTDGGTAAGTMRVSDTVTPAGAGITGFTAVDDTPALRFTTEQQSATAPDHVTFGGTVSALSQTTVQVYDHGTLIGTTTADASSGAWSLDTVLAAGQHFNFTAVATNAAGAVSTAGYAGSYPVSYVTGVTGQPFTTEADYHDATGHLFASVYSRSDGSLYELDSYGYYADGSRAFKNTTATDGTTTSQMAVQGQPYASTLTVFNQQHQLVSTVYQNADGSTYEQVAYGYASDGTLAFTNTRLPDGTETSLSAVTGNPNCTQVFTVFDTAGHAMNQVYSRTDGSTYESVQSFGDGTIVRQDYDTSGQLASKQVDRPNGTHEVATYHVTGQSYVSSAILYDSNYHVLTREQDYADGTHTIAAEQAGQNIFATSDPDRLIGTSAGGDMFVFHAGFGADQVFNYNPGYDTIQLAGVTDHAGLRSAIANAHDDASGNAVLMFGAHDMITFQGIHADQVQQHASDFFIA